MLSSIVLKGIELSARCGVTEPERSQGQPLLVDLIFQCPNQTAFQSDQLTDTIDYATVTQRVRDIGEGKAFALLESLAEQICQTLFQEFPITQLKIWVRKIRPPLTGIKGSVGVQLSRSRPLNKESSPLQPAPFLITQLPRLPLGKVLDIATGRGRHAMFLASKGFSVHGIDRDLEAINFLNSQAQQAKLSTITTEALDLELDSQTLPDFGTDVYDVILVFFYLFRPLFPQFLKALKSGGMILYETFLLENHIRRQHPRRKEFCLESNELLTLLAGCRILQYEEGDHEGTSETHRAYTARVLAQKP